MTGQRRFSAVLVRLALSLALMLGVAAAPATAATAQPAGAAAGNAQLQGLLDELVANGASGALAVVDDGTRTWRLSAGAARLDPYQQLRPSARFRAGSVTKTFVATVALRLVGQGRIRLDDSVQRWLPGLVPDGDAITLRMLLNHTGGVFDYTEDEQWIQQTVADPTRVWTPRQLIAVATAHQPTFPPGAGWSYSNTGYVIAGLMIEAATGQSVESLIRREITGPLGLAGTSLPTGPGIAGYHARGYLPPSLSGVGYVDVTRFSPSVFWTAGSLVSTADDLRRFYRALLGGRLLDPAQLTQMLTLVPVLPVVGYGLGIYAQRGPCGTTWGHNGVLPGYRTVAFHDRSGRRSAVVMLPTEPDPALDSLFQLTVDTAVCQMFGAVPPSHAQQAPTLNPFDKPLLGSATAGSG